MKLKERGKNTSLNEVTNIGKDGFWFLHEGKEFFVAFSEYPVFQNAKVKDVYNMKIIAPGQLRWEALDCDIETAALQSPEKFPLGFK